MPHFQLNLPPSQREVNVAVANYGAKLRREHRYYALDDFAKGYVEAMFFSNGDTCDDNESLLNDLGVDKLTIRSIGRIKRACEQFQKRAAPLLELAYACEDYDEAQAGHDFWFTRQCHGVGFWDRGQLRHDIYHHPTKHEALSLCNEGVFAGVLGDLLSQAAKSFHECDVSVSRGWIHVNR